MPERITPERRSEIMRRVRSKNTRPEMVVRRLLHRMGYRFRLHRKDLPGRPDVVLPKYKTVVFVHGCFWHGHDCRKGLLKPVNNAEFWAKKIDGNVARDARNMDLLKEAGWTVIVVWECRLKDQDHLRLTFAGISARHA